MRPVFKKTKPADVPIVVKRNTKKAFPQKLHYFIINKPFGFLSQFTDSQGGKVLGTLFDFPRDVYPVGRLDKDSEGLILLTNDPRINHLLLHPEKMHERTYWVQVENIITDEALDQLRKGVNISANKENYMTLPTRVSRLDESTITFEERDPPPRIKHGSSWIEIVMKEGKNRQVRHMTAAVGFPTLRLVRVAIENVKLGSLLSGDVVEMNGELLYKKLKITPVQKPKKK